MTTLFYFEHESFLFDRFEKFVYVIIEIIVFTYLSIMNCEL